LADPLINDEQHHYHAPVKGRAAGGELVNETGVDQPCRLHGFFFHVVASEGAPTAPRPWTGTVEHRAARMMGHVEVVL